MEDLRKLQQKIKAFCEKRDWDQFHNAKDLAIGMSTEAGELLDIFRFKSAKEIEEMFSNEAREKIEDELSDVFYFVLRLAQRYNINLYNALVKKLEKNEIKYPVHKAKGSNKKYTEL